ncbi:hypothetical protein [Kamptonema formosum]|uniref:hypothetical protein n=1 Tax=Kamptonema formosum TaxID=331992 RepID=UPI0002F604F7|nr:hypothetical protein [Kamptonema formosum]
MTLSKEEGRRKKEEGRRKRAKDRSSQLSVIGLIRWIYLLRRSIIKASVNWMRSRSIERTQ